MSFALKNLLQSAQSKLKFLELHLCVDKLPAHFVTNYMAACVCLV